ncbi:MAG: TonB-dependent receptor plug domain-containing protein, partial [Mariprofundus sp.]|nr:TonB-dependent receptor plug domain-containing protein [Mariprofundus sp.]
MHTVINNHHIRAHKQFGLLLAASMLVNGVANAAEQAPVIKVTDTAIESANTVTIKPTEQDYIPTDTADALKSVPGANVNKNGPLTGIAQYRGMFGSRINTQLDGLNVAPAGPNWMDPPLSHIPPSQLESISVIRGISPVSEGAESIGGTIKAKTATLPFSSDGELAPHGTLSTGYDSNNKAFTAGGQLGISSGSDRIQFNGNFDKGQDMKAGNGLKIVPTQYQRRNLGADYGHRFDGGDFN